MRPDYGSSSFLGLRMPVSILLMIVLTVCFALEQVDIAYFGGAHLQMLMLSSYGVRHGFIWQLLTFQFLHAGLWHLLGNLIGIWFFGPFVEERLGKNHFVALYLLSGVAGGILQSLLMLAFPMHYAPYLLGASCGVMALIAVFAMIDPDAAILLFFILPIRAKYLFYAETAIALFFTIVPSDPSTAWAAHLGGILFGVGYLQWFVKGRHSFAEWNPLKRRMRSERMIRAATVRPSLASLRRRGKENVPPDLPSDEFISKEVDPILDKISEHGIQSLTERERAILQAARNKMSKR